MDGRGVTQLDTWGIGHSNRPLLGGYMYSDKSSEKNIDVQTYSSYFRLTLARRKSGVAYMK